MELKNDLLPPEELVAFIGGDFKENGEHFFRLFTELGGLEQNERVLDVGCGVGRIAVPLTRYLNQEGSYEGFDIYKPLIDWCVKHISKQSPNFHFQLADIYSKQYNPAGKYTAAEYRLPFDSESFDFVLVTSVFTHMLPHDVRNYLFEISRVLKVGGRAFATYFLLNPESLDYIEADKSSLDFQYTFENHRILNKDIPEYAVAYDEQFIQGLYKRYGLDISGPVHYGAWCGRQNFLSYQDIIIAHKKHRPSVYDDITFKEYQPRDAVYGQQTNLLTKAWHILTKRGVCILAKEMRQYLRWRFKDLSHK
jgi:SAM-dependent methyltransferase